MQIAGAHTTFKAIAWRRGRTWRWGIQPTVSKGAQQCGAHHLHVSHHRCHHHSHHSHQTGSGRGKSAGDQIAVEPQSDNAMADCPRDRTGPRRPEGGGTDRQAECPVRNRPAASRSSATVHRSGRCVRDRQTDHASHLITRKEALSRTGERVPLPVPVPVPVPVLASHPSSTKTSPN